MVKFEGYTGIKLDWLLDRLTQELQIERELTKRLLVDAIFELTDFGDLVDGMADLLADTKYGETVNAVVRAGLREREGER